MAHRRREGGGPDSDRSTRPADPAAELEAVLDELEVRFLLDPDTTFETTVDTDARPQQ
ncbi:MAG TPA: hypothetical protein VFK42_14310 [Acidimicrobiales bacterium]|jgi:hypothetical protein|nr:hypothetical protein [Acidimicrobiales bacterium]